MNDFLENLKKILIADSSLLDDNLSNFVYAQLNTYNLGNNQEPLEDISPIFDKWIERNKDNENLITFVGDIHPYFCQIYNKNPRDLSGISYKLYIPLDKEHIYEGVNQLFDFIDKSGIEHNSKIAREIRNDNVVIRVVNKENVEKIIDFVKNNNYIQEGLLNTNPFTVNINGVGIAKNGKDGTRSYNRQVSNSLASFIILLAQKNRLEDLNEKYLFEYLKETEKYGDKDLHNISHLITEIVSGRKISLDEFTEIVDNNINKEDILKEAVRLTYRKYGNDHTLNALSIYRQNGDTRWFTRDNGIRRKLGSLTKEDIDNIFNSQQLKTGFVYQDYINSVVNAKTDYDYLKDAYFETLKKYGESQAEFAIGTFIVEGDSKYITNSNNARDNLNKISKDSIETILRENLNIYSVCTLSELSNEFIKELKQTHSIKL